MPIDESYPNLQGMETEMILDRLGELYGELSDLAADERRMREQRQSLSREVDQLEGRLRAARGLDKGGRPVGTRDPTSARGRVQALIDAEPGREWNVEQLQQSLSMGPRQVTGAVTALAREVRIRRVRRGVYASRFGTVRPSARSAVQRKVTWPERLETVLTAINANPGQLWTAAGVVKAKLEDSHRRASIILRDLTREKKLRRVSRGFYTSLKGVKREPPKARKPSPLHELRGRIGRAADDLPNDTQEVIDSLVRRRVVPW